MKTMWILKHKNFGASRLPLLRHTEPLLLVCAMCLISLSFSGCTREAKETSLMPHQGNQEFVRSGSPVGAVGGKASSDSAAITSQEQTEKTIAPKGNMESAQNTQADSPAEIETLSRFRILCLLPLLCRMRSRNPPTRCLSRRS